MSRNEHGRNDMRDTHEEEKWHSAVDVPLSRGSCHQIPCAVPMLIHAGALSERLPHLPDPDRRGARHANVLAAYYTREKMLSLTIVHFID
eukprot:2566952-Pleurochrysis_carterae.AAC.2